MVRSRRYNLVIRTLHLAHRWLAGSVRAKNPIRVARPTTRPPTDSTASVVRSGLWTTLPFAGSQNGALSPRGWIRPRVISSPQNGHFISVP